MIRISGILCGSAIAIALLILFLGVPGFSEGEAEPETLAMEAATWAVEPALPEEPRPIEQTDLPEPAAAVEEPELPADDAALVDAIFAPVEEREVLQPEEPVAEPVHENWYAFWSPFRSEIAANGFVEELQRTTGLDYRVVRQKAGVYEVAFAYIDDGDIQDKLRAISAATGLDMPGG